MEATCVDCGYLFRYHAEFFEERGLAPPKRCRRCRERRRPGRTPERRVFGRVEYFNRARGFGFIHVNPDDRRGVYFTLTHVREGDDVAVGDWVSFQISDQGHRPRAHDVRKEHDDAVHA